MAFLLIYSIFFSLILAVVDLIEQVMSNAAIEKIDPLQRPSNSNNSLLSILVSNMGGSFGGMTNLDGLAKSSTNHLAGAYTKLSVLVIGILMIFVDGTAMCKVRHFFISCTFKILHRILKSRTVKNQC
ncbi:MAG: hypothetical protein ACYDD5_13385 [Sulfuricurvum sp.]